MGRPTRRRSRARRLLRVGLGLASAVVLALAGALGWLHGEPGRRWVRARVEQRLTERLGMEVRVGELDYGLLFRPIVLRDLSAGAAGDPTLSLGEARVVLDRWAFLSGRLHVEELSIRDARVVLDPSSPWPGPIPLSGRLPTMRIDALSVVDSSIRTPSGAVRALAATGRLSVDDGDLSTTLEGVTLRAERGGAPPVPVALDSLSLRVGDGASRIEARGLRFRLPRLGELRADLSASGPAEELAVELAIRAAGLTAKGRGVVAPGSGEIEATVEASADPDVLHALSTASPAPLALLARVEGPAELRLETTGNVREGRLDVDVHLDRLAMAGGDLAASGHGRLRDWEPVGAGVAVDLRDVDARAMATAAGVEAPTGGRLSGRVTTGWEGGATHLRYDLRLRPDRIAGMVRARGRLADGHLVGSLAMGVGGGQIRAEHSLPLDVEGGLPRLVADAPWRVEAVARDVRVRSLRRLLPELPDAIGPAVADAQIAIAGTMAEPRGRGRVLLRGRPLPLLAADHGLEVEATTRGGDAMALRATVRLDAEDHALVTAQGNATLSPGRPTVDLDVTLPARPLATLPVADWPAAGLPGRVQLRGRLTGSLEDPRLEGRARLDDYPTVDGGRGSVDVRVTAEGGRVRARGAVAGGGGPLAVTVDVRRWRNDGQRVEVALRATDVMPERVLPASLGVPGLADLGSRVSSDLVVTALVSTARARPEIVGLDLAGRAELTGGRWQVPGSERAYTNIAARVVGEGSRIRLEHLTLHESDLEVRDRSLRAEGVIELEAGQPRILELELRADRWLLFGAGPLGPADAPAATVSGRAMATVQLGAERHRARVELGPLELLSPDREPTGHWPEIASDGDLVFVDDRSLVGSLPRTEEPDGPPFPLARPVDLHVHLRRPVRIHKGLVDVTASGALDVTLGPGGTRTRGTLTAESGSLRFFGRRHELRGGSLVFDEARPEGYLDLSFASRAGDDALRDVSADSGGSEVLIRMRGRIGEQGPRVGGVANHALPGALTIYHVGRSRQVSAPGMPASETVHVLEGMRPMMLGFVAMNAPHLLFLDRLDVWADPSTGVHAYGRVQHVDARRRIAGGRGRLRFVARPPTPGRSEAELQIDHLLFDDDRLELGVGLRAGDRLGGGVGVHLDWSSR